MATNTPNAAQKPGTGILFIILAVVLIGGAVYYYGQKPPNSVPQAMLGEQHTGGLPSDQAVQDKLDDTKHVNPAAH